MAGRCEECGFQYLPPRLTPGSKNHRKYHDEFTNGIEFPTQDVGRVLYEEDGFRITVVEPTRPYAVRKRAERVAQRANQELPSSFGLYCALERKPLFNHHIFFGHLDKRAVALVSLQQRPTMFRADWKTVDMATIMRDPPPNCPKGRHPPEVVRENAKLWTVYLAWVLPKHRSKGLATQLVCAAAAWAGVSVQELGWVRPFTEAGSRLVCRHCPDTFFIGQ